MRPRSDEIKKLLGRMLTSDTAPVVTLVATEWRAALCCAGDSPQSARDARAVLSRLLTGA